jgi:hypothetical protein
LSGTAATASFALTLGGTGSVGFATTGAFSATSGSASSRLTQIEQVYATTGSNSFRATQSITGSLTVTGQIIAQTLNVQQVTSSIVFSSGSNVFGCDLNSRQTFTGSFYQTGSVAIFNSCVGIGMNNPTKKLHISGSGANSGISFDVDSGATAIIRGNTTANFDLNNEGSGGGIRLYGSAIQFRTNVADPAVVISNAGEVCFCNIICAPRAYLGSCLLINQTTSLLDVTTKVEMSGIGSTFPTTQASYNVFANHGTNSTWVGYLNFNKSRGTTQGSVTATADGDRIGMIRFNAADGTEQIRATEIYSDVDGAPSKCCVPGRIVFATAGANLNGPIERMRITSTGVSCFACQICSPAMDIMTSGIGVNTASGILKVITAGTAPAIGIGQSNANRYTQIGANDYLIYGDDFFIGTRCAFPIAIGTCYTTRLRFDSCGIACFSCQVCTPAGTKFGGGASTLNNYDEGKWCVYACGSSSGAGAVGEGSYTRIGRLVTATFLINNVTFPSYSGVLRLSLPFTAGSGTGLSGNTTWNAGGVYFFPLSGWCSGANFTSLDAVVLNGTNYALLAVGNVNGDRQTSVGSTNTNTSGGSGLYLRFTITYEV